MYLKYAFGNLDWTACDLNSMSLMPDTDICNFSFSVMQFCAMLENYGGNEITEVKIRIAIQKRAKCKVLDNNVNFPIIKKTNKKLPKSSSKTHAR